MLNSTAVRPKKQPPTLDRTTFFPEVITTSRMLDCIGSAEEWQRQSGYSIEDSPLGVARELIDNSLDACEETDVPPVISIKLDETGIEVLDNGPGIAQTTIKAMLDFGKRTSSRAGRCSISRGQQGNGGQACLALPFVLNGQVGRVDIASHGVLHEISVTVDRFAQMPVVITDNKKDSLVKNGTFFKLWIPSDMWVSEEYKKAQFLQIVENFGWFNPHLTMHVECFGKHRDILPTDPAWRKFRPSDAVPPQWYSQEKFNGRVTACISSDMAHCKDRLLSEFVREFRGLSSSAKQKEVWDATGLARQPLSSLLNGKGLQTELVTRLYRELVKRGNAIKPEGLGIIGKSHIEAKMVEDGCDIDDDRKYKRADGIDEDGVPFVVEMAFATRKAGPRMVRGVNWSAMIGNPFGGEFRPNDFSISSYSPVMFFVHVARPAIQSTDRGKAHVVISKKIQEVMNEVLEKVGGGWRKIVLADQRANEADDRAEERLRKQAPKEKKKRQKGRLKKLIYQVLPAAIKHYRATMGAIIWERQLFYNVRHDGMAIDDSMGTFSQQTFKTILKEYEKDFGDIEGLSNKPRGTFVEPHTGRRLPLGTMDVAKYIIPNYEYGSIMIIEKGGFEEGIDASQIAKKYDLGIVFNEGYSVDACKALIQACRDKGITVFLLHDTDPAGYVIYDAVRRDCHDIIDISFTMEECLALGKTPETDYRRCALPECILPLLTPKTLEVFKGVWVRNPNPGKYKKPTPCVWKYGRVELNDLATNPAEFIALIEGRLKKHGAAKKLLPPPAVIKLTAEQYRDQALLASATECLYEILDVSGMAFKMVSKVKLSVTNIPGELKKWAKELPPDSWKNHVSWLVDQKIAGIDDVLAQLAQDAVESIGGAIA
ncbi:MAG: ATP-binding protein [Planctomycetota bacterium]